jgi:hypothetical protein
MAEQSNNAQLATAEPKKQWGRRNLGCICPVLKWAPVDAPGGTRSVPETAGQSSSQRRVKKMLPCGFVLQKEHNLEVRIATFASTILFPLAQIPSNHHNVAS